MKSTKHYRPLDLTRESGDVEWIRTKVCPNCKTGKRLMLSPGGEHSYNRIVCLQCGHRFMLKGRPC